MLAMLAVVAVVAVLTLIIMFVKYIGVQLNWFERFGRVMGGSHWLCGTHWHSLTDPSLCGTTDSFLFSSHHFFNNREVSVDVEKGCDQCIRKMFLPAIYEQWGQWRRQWWCRYWSVCWSQLRNYSQNPMKKEKRKAILTRVGLSLGSDAICTVTGEVRPHWRHESSDKSCFSVVLFDWRYPKSDQIVGSFFILWRHMLCRYVFDDWKTVHLLRQRPRDRHRMQRQSRC